MLAGMFQSPPPPHPYCEWLSDQSSEWSIVRVADPDTGGKKDRSTSNYCMSLDRGYGHIDGQHALAEAGIYSNSMMQKDRVGLPREFISILSKDLGKCTGGENQDGDDGDGTAEGAGRKRKHKCTHGPDETDCQKFCWTALHKGDWELRWSCGRTRH